MFCLISICNFLYFEYFCFAVCRSSPLLQISNMPSALRCFCTRRKQLSRYWGKRLVANRKGKAPDKTRRLDQIDLGHTIQHFIQCQDSWYYCHGFGGKKAACSNWGSLLPWPEMFGLFLYSNPTKNRHKADQQMHTEEQMQRWMKSALKRIPIDWS